MRTPAVNILVCILAGVALLVSAHGADPGIPPASAREATLDLAKHLVAAPKALPSDTVTKDPFYPTADDLRDPVEKAARGGDTLPDLERLGQLAAAINPTGSIELGGEPYLLFTEKRQKKGDKLTIMIDAVEYEVEIVSIEKSRFRIRYKGLEMTRSIK